MNSLNLDDTVPLVSTTCHYKLVQLVGLLFVGVCLSFHRFLLVFWLRVVDYDRYTSSFHRTSNNSLSLIIGTANCFRLHCSCCCLYMLTLWRLWVQLWRSYARPG